MPQQCPHQVNYTTCKLWSQQRRMPTHWRLTKPWLQKCAVNPTGWDWAEDPAQGVPHITARQEHESWIFGTPGPHAFVTLISICFYLIYSLLGYDFKSSTHVLRAVSQDHVWHDFLISSPHFPLLHTFVLLGQLFYQVARTFTIPYTLSWGIWPCFHSAHSSVCWCSMTLYLFVICSYLQVKGNWL